MREENMQVETFKAEGQKSLFNQIDLDLERTKRVYKVLGDLSEKAMGSLQSGALKEFSFGKPLPVIDQMIILQIHFKLEVRM